MIVWWFLWQIKQTTSVVQTDWRCLPKHRKHLPLFRRIDFFSWKGSFSNALQSERSCFEDSWIGHIGISLGRVLHWRAVDASFLRIWIISKPSLFCICQKSFHWFSSFNSLLFYSFGVVINVANFIVFSGSSDKEVNKQLERRMSVSTFHFAFWHKLVPSIFEESGQFVPDHACALSEVKCLKFLRHTYVAEDKLTQVYQLTKLVYGIHTSPHREAVKFGKQGECLVSRVIMKSWDASKKFCWLLEYR